MAEASLKAIFFMRYYLTYLKKNWGLQVMMLTLCGITMAILVSLSDISETFLASQQQSLDQIANREIVIASQDLNGKGYYDAFTFVGRGSDGYHCPAGPCSKCLSVF